MKRKLSNNLVLLLSTVIAFVLISGNTIPEDLKNKELLRLQNSTRGKINADLETVRKRTVDDLLKQPFKKERIKQLVETIQSDGSWPGIDYKDTSRTGFQHGHHLENMLELAKAYKKTGSDYYGNPSVKKTVSAALDFWIAHDFICENWWWNEMGTPHLMINTLLVLDTDLTDSQRTEGIRIAGRANFTGFGARAGGDFVPIAGMVCKQALFKRDEAMLKNAIKVMTDQINITETRGINPDMGFHHRLDNVTSIHTYGTNYVRSFAYWAVKFSGTEFTLPSGALKLLIDYSLDGICKSMAYSIYPDPGAENRDLARKGAVHAAGVDIIQNLMITSDYRKKELENILQIRNGTHQPNLVWDKYFWHSSYFTHQRKNYFASVRMHSSRQNNVEQPYNEEGLKMHHLADGANFISRTGKEYLDIFPVWDWQKIPGTTIVQKQSLPPSKEIAKKGLSDFAGGVTNGEFGASAFDFKSVHDPLTARKAWFFFDREYVCLGANIQSESEYPVVTNLNQSLLKSDVLVRMKNVSKTLKKGLHQLDKVSWVLQDSVAYVFPTATTIHVSNMAATGKWQDITHQAWAMKEPVIEKDLFTLWIDHGAQPQKANYEYVVVPGINATGLDNYLKNSAIAILSNTSKIQAVQHKNLNLVQIVFYKSGSLKLPGGLELTVESPCMIMLKTIGKHISEIAVSDPTQKLKSLEFTVNTLLEVKGDKWHTERNKEKKNSTIRVALPQNGYAGESVAIKLQH